MIELPHLEWTATASQVGNGLIPLHRARLGPDALNVIRMLCPAHEDAVRRIVSETLCGAHPQKVHFRPAAGSIRVLLVIPMGAKHPWICTRHARRVYELHHFLTDAGTSELVPWPVIPIPPLARWNPTVPVDQEIPRRKRALKWVVWDYQRQLDASWTRIMLRMGDAGVPEKQIVELTARLGIPVMRELTEAACRLLGSWNRGARARGARGSYFSTASLISYRNRTQAEKAFPMLKRLLNGSWEDLDPEYDLLTLAIEHGQPLVETVTTLYGLSRPLIDLLRFPWPESAVNRDTPVINQLRRLAPLAPEALPQSGHEMQRLQQFLNHPLSDMADAVLRSHSDGCTRQVRTLVKARYSDELLGFATFLCHATSESGVQAVDGRMTLQAWLGRPTLAQWLRAARRWHRLRMQPEFADYAGALFATTVGSVCPETWPVPIAQPVMLEGWSYRFIASTLDLEREGETMEHCARLLASVCASGKQCVAHVIAPDGLPATLLLDAEPARVGLPRFCVRQISGPRNAQVTPATRAAAERFAETLSQGSLDMDPAYTSWVSERPVLPEPEPEYEIWDRREALNPLIGALSQYGPECLESFRECFDLEGPEAGWGSGGESLFEFISSSISTAMADSSASKDRRWRRLLA